MGVAKLSPMPWGLLTMYLMGFPFCLAFILTEMIYKIELHAGDKIYKTDVQAGINGFFKEYPPIILFLLLWAYPIVLLPIIIIIIFDILEKCNAKNILTEPCMFIIYKFLPQDVEKNENERIIKDIIE